MEDFYAVAQQVHDERVNKRYYDYLRKREDGEYIYYAFYRWCLIRGEDETNAQVFAKFLNEEGIKLTPRQRRMIATNHFGWQFTYNHETEKWETRRVRQ